MPKTVFSDGDKAQGIKGTKVSAAHLNGLQNHRHTGQDADGACPSNYAAATGTANAIAVALVPALTAHVAGMPIQFKATAANTGAVTLAINGLAAVAVKRPDGTALVAGDIKAEQLVEVAYDGTYYQMMSAVAAIDPANAYILIVDEKAAGTAGGSFTAGAWRTRDLNTVKANPGGYASLASNQITLQPGTYRFRIQAPTGNVQSHMARVQNITAGTTIATGMSTNAIAPSNTYVPTCSSLALVSGQFTLAISSVLEVQHYCSETKNTSGFGLATGFGQTETYTTAEFWRVK